MFGLGKKQDSSDYSAGYNAGEEFLDLADHYLSDEEANAQWDAVESGHSKEYVQGFAASIEHNSRGFFSQLLGG